MKTMTIQEFINEVDDGKYFSVKFIKKDNTLREMTARRGVHKDVKNDSGTNGSWNRKQLDAVHEVLTVYDANKYDENKSEEDNRGAHRRINLKTIQEVKLHGIHYSMDTEKGILVEQKD